MIFKEKKEYYSLRKFKGVGLASALVGLSFMSQGVLAEESPVVSPNGSSNSVVVPNPTADNQKVEGDVKPTTEVASPMTTNTSVKETVENTDNLKETDSADKSEVADVVNSSVESVVEDKKPVVTNVVSSENKPVSEGVTEITESKEKEVGGKPDTTSPSTTLVSTESTQPVRSRRGKRSTSENPATIVNLPLNYGNASIPMNVSNITETNKIDYTTSSNPSLESDISDKKVYNNQIESIEKVSTANKDSHRFRIKLKDGQTIPNGGKLVLATLGGGSPTSKELVIGSETVGKITEFRPSTKGTNTLADRLNSSTTVADYIRTFENMSTKDLPANSLVLEFNSNFSKYNLNRLVEFELESRTLNLVDYSLVRKNGLSSSSDAVIDSSGTSHTLEKRFTSYLLNPYDSKGLALDNTKAYISVKSAPTGTPVSNELTVDMDWGNATKPNYLNTVYTPTTGSFRVSNRASSADSVVARKGSVLTYRLPDDSLFATSKYSVGDIVTLNYSDNVRDEERVSSNRFTDTDNYVNLEKPTSNPNQNRTGTARFKLLERTEKGYKWELLDDLTMENSTLYMSTVNLTPVELRSDWVSRFGEANLKRFLEGDIRSASSYLKGEQLKAYATWTSNGVTKEVSRDGLINKNTNLILGENTTGTLKVVHKSETGEILKAESVIADNKPWYTPITIDPQNFAGYQFKRSSEVLSTIVGSGERTIELTYAKPSERVSKEPISVTYVVDNTKDGNYRNEVVGTPKTTITRTEYIYSAETRTATPKETVTVQEGTPTVVTLGTKPTTEVTYQDFTTRYVADPERTAGEKFTEIEGVRGTTTTETTYSVDKETGVVIPTKGQPVVIAPKDKVVKVGTKTKTDVVSTPKGTVYQADSGAAYESRTTSVAGRDGSTTTTTTYTLNITNGEVTPTTKVDTVEKQDTVIKIGNVRTEYEPLPKTTRYEANSDIDFEKKELQVEGQDGEITATYTYTVSPTDGSLSNPVRSVDENEDGRMLPDVYWVGNKKQTRRETPITTRYEANPEKLRDDKEVVSQGVLGVHTTTTLYKVDAATGTLSSPTVSETDVPMEPKVVKVGTKPTVSTETIAITTKYIADETLEFGKVVETEKGSEGKVVTTTTYTLNPTDGTTTANKPTVETTPMVQRVVKVGVKKKVVETPIEFITRYERDEEVEAGKKTPSVSGVAGKTITTTTYTMNPTTGVVTENPSTTVREEPITEVVKVGTKPKVEVTPVPFTTSYEATSSIENGETSDKVVGKDGKITTTTTYRIDPKTGAVSENSSTSVREEPTNRVVSVGSKSTTVITGQDYPTRYIEDSSKEVGFKETREKGVKGTTSVTTTYSVDPTSGKVIPKEEAPVVVAPKEEVVAVGNKSKVEVVTIPKTIRYEKDSEKDKGVLSTSVEGSDGSKTTTTTYTVNPKTGDVTPSTPVIEIVPAVEKVVKVGAKDKVDVTPIPSPIRYEGDTRAEKGSPNKEVKGLDGSSTVTTTYSVDPKTGFVAETVGSPVVVKATETVIKVGAKSKVVVTPIPIEVDEIADPELFEGDEKVTSNGKAGSTTTTTEYVINPKTGEITEKDPVVSTVPMEKKVVHKGTKKRKASVTISYVLKDTGASLGSATLLENMQVGSPYNTSGKVFEPKVEVTELADRTITKTTTYVLEKEPDNKSGIVSENGVSVVYTYRALVREKVVMKESKLTVNFVLEGTGEKLHASLIKESVKVGDPYVTEPLVLKDKVEKRVERNKEVVITTKYEVVENPKNARGLIGLGGTVVNFTYRAVVSSEEFPTIPNDAPKVDGVDYTEPIHVNGPVEYLDIPEFTGGVNPYDAPIYEKPELKIEEPAFNSIIGETFPRKEVPRGDTDKVSDSSEDNVKVPSELKPSVDTPNDASKVELPKLEVPKEEPNVEGKKVEQPKEEPRKEQLPYTGMSSFDTVVSTIGSFTGLLGLGYLSRKRKH